MHAARELRYACPNWVLRAIVEQKTPDLAGELIVQAYDYEYVEMSVEESMQSVGRPSPERLATAIDVMLFGVIPKKLARFAGGFVATATVVVDEEDGAPISLAVHVPLATL